MSLEALPELMPPRNHIQPARMLIRRNIAERIDLLRGQPEAQRDLQRQCHAFLASKAGAAADKLAAIELRQSIRPPPYDERRRAVAGRRHETLTQQVMEPYTAGLVIPKSLSDGLAHRRWVVLLAIAQSYTQLSHALLLHRISGRHSSPKRALACLQVHLTEAANMERLNAIKVIESAACRYAITRRILRKRAATTVLFRFLRLRQHMLTIRRNVRLVRNQVVQCQRCVRAYLTRRRWRLAAWELLWLKLEVEAGPPSSLLTGTPSVKYWWPDVRAELLKQTHLRLQHNFLKEIRRWRRARGGDTSPVSRRPEAAVPTRRDLAAMVTQARRILRDWVGRADSGATSDELFSSTFQRKQPLRRRSTAASRLSHGALSGLTTTSSPPGGTTPSVDPLDESSVSRTLYDSPRALSPPCDLPSSTFAG
jgi:hypothetical protein